jgi:hypothetical protein
LAVAGEAQRQGLATRTAPAELEALVDAHRWEPRYQAMRLKR